MERECRQINYNWRQVGPLRPDDGQEFDCYVVGNSKVVSITSNYKVPEVFYVEFEDSRMVTVRNINQAFYFPVTDT